MSRSRGTFHDSDPLSPGSGHGCRGLLSIHPRGEKPMTMTIDRTSDRSSRRTSSASASQRLRSNFAAVRVSFTWLGVRKTLSTEQKAQAAESFGAEGQYLSAAKKLLDT